MGPNALPALAAGSYVHWGVIQISVTNLIVIGAMLLLFVAALLAPFPGSTQSGKAGAQSRIGRRRGQSG